MEEKKGKSSGLLIAVLIIIMLALVAGMVYLFLENQKLYQKFNDTIVELNKNASSSEKTDEKVVSNLVDNAVETPTKSDTSKTEETEGTESLYAIVEKLAKKAAIERHPAVLSDNTTDSVKAKNVIINDIEICTKEYVDIMVENKRAGEYSFQQNDLKTGKYEALGTITFTLEFDEDVSNRSIIPFESVLKDEHHIIVTRGYRVSKVNGEYTIEFGEG